MSTPTSGTFPTTGGTRTTGSHNQADITFLTEMIPHHAQAVQMADMAASKATNPGVKSIASTIKAAQTGEITEMSGWLTGWGQAVPSTSMSGMSGVQQGTGMMSAGDMAKLNKSTGHAFDRRWVRMMITHHKGAVTMAKTEQSAGQNTAAKKLAQSIITSQTAQIGQLTTMLTQLPA